MKVDILAFGAHPDDVELSCSGTLLRHLAMGRTAGIIDLTLGELGTRGNAKLRTKEAKESAGILGVSFRTQLNFKDGFFVNDEEHQRVLIEHIRLHQPEIVLCNAKSDRHPDHGRAAQLVADACYLAGLVKIRTTHNGKDQKAWRPKAVYHYVQDNYEHPDFVIDISAFAAKKFKAIRAFSSQFYDPKSKAPETPISSKDFFKVVEGKMAQHGRSIGVKYAEGFTVNRYPGVNSLFDLL